MTLSCETPLAAVALHQVSKVWGDATALHPSNLSVETGQFTVLLGPSGCGKSTTLRLIAGLDSPSQGQIWVRGQDMTHASPAQRDIGMVFQNYALFPHLHVADNILFGLQVRKTPKKEQQQRLHDVLQLLNLQHLAQRKPAQLSGGQQQRVALARALVAQRNICLMDEPLSNLDAQLRQEMRQELRALQQKLGLTVVYVTHDQTEAMSMADQVVLLNQGRIEQVAPPIVMYNKPASVFAARFIGSPAMNVLELDALPESIQRLAPAEAASLGVRCEAISHQSIQTEMMQLTATVTQVEYLGADVLLHCAVDDDTSPDAAYVIARCSGNDKSLPHPKQAITLAWSMANTHWFDAQGQRISNLM